ncbi:MAG: SPOR domain-containing protein [Pseudomonadota bacterium]
MTNRAGEPGYGDDDRLPWLESVEEDYSEGPGFWRVALLVVLGLAVIAAVVFGYWWYQRQRGISGNGELITAPAGDYKVKPDQPGGMKVDGEGDTVFATSEGETANASINLDAAPEAPVQGTILPTPTATATGASRVTVRVPTPGAATTASPVPAPSGPAGGAVIQLGAFPDESGANAAWGRMAKAFPVLAPLGHSVQKSEKDGKTVYRLRVNAGSNGQAQDICARITAAGQGCYVAN